MVNLDAPSVTPKPTALTRSRRKSPVGAEVAETATRFGQPLFGWQRQVVDVALERSVGGWRFPLVTVCVPRQSGKTTMIGMVALHRCLSQAGARVWFTAQSRMDAVLRWEDLVAVLRRSDLVEAPARAHTRPEGWDFVVHGATGKESVEFANGAQLRVFAPADDSLHGSVTDLVVVDEARFLEADRGAKLLKAIMPTQATRDGQVWIISTAGDAESSFWWSQVVAGRRAVGDRRARRCHAEWSIGQDVPGRLLEAVWAAHPSAGLPGGLRRDKAEIACDTMPAWDFAQEYGNRWASAADARLLPQLWWDRARQAEFPAGPVTFGVDVAPDRSSATITACAGGVVEVVAHRDDGAFWAADRVVELAGRWPGSSVILDGMGPASSLRPSLLGRVVLTAAPTRDVVAACNAFYDGLAGDPPTVGHRGSPHLDAAVETATRRTMGQSWMFSRYTAAARCDSVLLSAVLAWWGERGGSVEAVPRPAVF